MPAEKKFIADFHIHSHFSLATSKNLTPEHLEYWARIKGLNVIGTGDCIHPGWLKELSEKLEPAENGLFRLKNEYKLDSSIKLANKNIPEQIFFMLTGEISNIYKKAGKVRKVHNLCVFPDFEAVQFVQNSLKKFNIESDGRPILGLDSKILLDIVLNSSDMSFLVPAHIWTPWFSVLGSKSGFDTIEECYDELTKHIFAVETGLSSDPAMNWTCGFLDKFKLISNSDAHSPEKLGREANLFETEIAYKSIYDALSGKDGFLGTIEFFPQEGKYHYDGHRKCGVCWDPLKTLEHNALCPVCGKPVTMGVMYRVAELADRDGKEKFANKREFYSITSLPDILAELMNKKSNSNKTVRSEYFRLIENLGSEFHILLFADIEDIKSAGGELLAEGIKKLRTGNVLIDEGYDGEFGRIKVFSKEELASFAGSSLFGTNDAQDTGNLTNKSSSVKFNIREFQTLKAKTNLNDIVPDESFSGIKLSAEQSEAVKHFSGPCMVLAGPGSGKTRILTERIKYLTMERGIDPANILAITFSNKAADEIRTRIREDNDTINPAICTFHAFGMSVLKSHYKIFERPEHFYIIDPEEKKEIIEEIAAASGRDIKKTGKKTIEIEKYKQGISAETDISFFVDYNRNLQIRGAFDLDDLISLPVELFQTYPDIAAKYRKQHQWILIDEFQDINAKQFELITELSGKNNPNLFAIGDPDQSIYGFRGSDIKYIGKIKETFPQINVISLPDSYRCPSNIIKAAGQILEKTVFLNGKNEKVKVNIQQADTEKSEADWIAAQIEKMMGGVRSFSMDSGISDGEAKDGTGSFSDFAILCRTSIMFAPVIKALADHGIAYQVIGTDPFYSEKPFSEVIRRFRSLYYHTKNYETTTLKFIKETQMIEKKENINIILSEMMKSINAADENCRRMSNFAQGFGNDYDRFFSSLSLRHGVDELDNKAEAVSVLTIHASKGLEFNTVFIPGCEEGVIPFELFGKKNEREIAEEERLFYVGMTRTKKNLYLTFSKKRLIRGRLLTQKKSRLLDRLEKNLLAFGKREKKKKKDDGQLDLFG
ncbi:MAG: UvrD-helicase domain-containing protein [Spirochaetota bacterium]